MQDNYSFLNKNIWFYKVKLKKQVKLLKLKEHKWFKLLKNSLVSCQKL